LDVLTGLLDEIVVPPAVAREIGPEICRLGNITDIRLRRSVDPRIVAAQLGAGESEAISLAIESGKTRVVLDDGPARRVAALLSVPVIGTAGLLLMAKDRTVIPAVKPIIGALMETGFHLHDEVIATILTLAGGQ
jgi:predicted nucleic acid-binding protein